MSDNLCKKCGAPVDEGVEMCEKCFNEEQKTAQPAYIEYVVEEEAVPQKKFSGLKIVSLVLGIISGLLLLYYAIDITISNISQIKQYTAMGMQIPASSLIVVFLSLGLLYLVAASSIVGGLLPNKFAKCSILLLAIPASWGIINGVPQLVMSIISKATYQELSQSLYVGLSGLFTLAAAIFAIFGTKEKTVACCDCDSEFEYEETVEEAENEEITAAVSEPEQSEAIEETEEETNKTTEE